MRQSQDLEGQIALVTGASSGIGRFAARLLACNGARVALCARRSEPLASATAEIEAAGGSARWFVLDVSHPEEIDVVVDTVWRELGPVSILINNAGANLLGDALSVTIDDLDRLYAVNIRGAFAVAQSVGRRMIADKVAGRIVNLGSIAGLRAMPQLGVYGMSKAAIIHMTKVLAREWARHDINVCALCPGYFRTEMTAADLGSEAAARLIERLPRRRVGSVEDLEAALSFLLAPGAKFVNGAIVPVDDGLSVT